MCGDVAFFAVKFFVMDELIIQTNITHSDYKTLYPLFTFVVSKEKEKLKSFAVDIKITANFTENIPANTRAFLHLHYQARGCHSNKLSVVY